ncbi:alpha/beta hydrolase [Myceligenerans crystallogenes]|uniref:Alpha/beta hydrolase n=1 Tax=Myceligenerans crystallogenes TaxID=316335 RepID=A0ABN2NE42_9MICO
MSSWSPDVLGDGFEARPVNAPDDDRVVTVVRHVPSTTADGSGQDGAAKPAVLYVHGFVDYFFQTHVAEHIVTAGHPFYAVDLYGYGRSVRDGEDRTAVPLLQEHSADLDAALRVLRDEGHERVVLLAHSMGGLLSSLWVAAHPGAVVGLMLNSPWFGLNRGWFDRVVSTRLVYGIAPALPRAKVNALGGDYATAMHRHHEGEWDFDLRWKPDSAFPVRAAWFASIRRAQAKLARGLSIDVPVLVTTSDATSPGRTREEHLTTDTVLNVRHMWDLAPALGENVQVEIIPGGAHDLALSPPTARKHYLKTITTWLDATF